MFLKFLAFLFCNFCLLSVLYGQDSLAIPEIDQPIGTVIRLNDVQEILHRYELAEHFYSQGKLDSVSKILSPYLKDRRLLRKADRSMRAEIYRLAGLNYILADSLAEAEKSIKNVLNNKHNYQVRQGDLLSFKAALDTMYISPRFTLGLRLGWVGSILTQSKNFSVAYSTNKSVFTESYPFNATGFSLSLSTSYYLTRRLALMVEPSFVSSSYAYQLSYSGLNSGQIETAAYSYEMNFTALEVPIVAKYHLLRKPLFSPYLLAGVSYRYLFNANKIASSLSLDYTSIMQQHNYGAVLGLGFAKSIGKRTVFSIDTRYINYLALLNRTDKRFLNNGKGNIDIFLYNVYDAIDDLTMQNIQVNFTIAYYLTYKVF
jgi:outer membrane protein W